MANNEAPPESEMERMVELYGRFDSYQDVAEHDDIDWSRPTVTKWVKRAEEMAELYEDLGSFEAVADHDDIVLGEDTVKTLVETWESECIDGLLNPDRDNDPMSAGPDDEPRAEPEGDYTADHPVEQVDDDARETATERTGAAAAVDDAGGDDEEVPPEEKYDHVLEDKPDSPNEVLLNVLDAEPNLDGDHIGYIRSQLDYRGMMSPEEVVALMDDMSISSKNKTIARVRRDYNQRLNQVMRENDDIAQYDEWATYLTKITGDPAYVKDTGVEGTGGDDVLQVPPNQQPAGRQAGGQAVPAAQPSGSQAQTTAPQTGQQAQPPTQPGNRSRTVPDNGGREAAPSAEGQLDPFQQKLLELLEEQMDDDDSGAVEPQPTPESEDPASMIDEFMEMQEKMQKLQHMAQDDDGDSGGEMEQMVELLDQRLQQLQSKIEESNGQQAAPTPQPSAESDSMLAEIAQVAEMVDDPDLVSTLVEMQMDSDVLEAKAKLKDAENEQAIKQAIAEAVDGDTLSTLVESGSSLMEMLSQPAAQQQSAQTQPTQQQGGQQRQAQPAQQPAQEPQPAQPVEEEQPTGVTAVEDDEGDDSGGSASPIREETEAEMKGSDEPEEPADEGGEE